MRALDGQLRSDLASGAAHLAQLWKIVRNDGAALYATDHDVDIHFEDRTYSARKVWRLDRLRQALNQEQMPSVILGGIDGVDVLESEITGGVWDQAHVEVGVIDWRRGAGYAPIFVGRIATLRVEADRVTATLEDLTTVAERPVGRLYGARCDAQLGDARCGVPLSGPPHKVNGTVAEIFSPTNIAVSMQAPPPAGWFRDGVLRAVGRDDIRILDDNTDGALRRFTLASALAPANVNLAVTLFVGCDKRWNTCVERFSNGLNFRGFPHMPGPDAVLSLSGLRTARTDAP